MSRMKKTTSWAHRRKKQMPAFRAPAFVYCGCQRSELATWGATKPTFQEAGTWRGSDIAAAATIVARSTRRVHMFAASNELSKRYLTHSAALEMPADSDHCVGLGWPAASDIALLAGAARGRV